MTLTATLRRSPAVKRAVQAVTVNAGRLTSPWRMTPDFLVIGGQRCGTTSMYRTLSQHPAVLKAVRHKGVHYFDTDYDKGMAWYRAHFPLQRTAAQVERRLGVRPQTFESAPYYMFHPLAAERIERDLPGVKVIVLLRDPVERAYSHYQHEVSFGREPLGFEEAIELEEERMEGELERMLADPGYFSHAWWNYTYVARGLYAEQLERWYASFPAEQLLVLANEELSAEPAATYARVLEFLGAAPHELESYPRVFDRDYPDLDAATRARLADRFAGPNRRLYELLGRDLGWD